MNTYLLIYTLMYLSIESMKYKLPGFAHSEEPKKKHGNTIEKKNLTTDIM